MAANIAVTADAEITSYYILFPSVSTVFIILPHSCLKMIKSCFDNNFFCFCFVNIIQKQNCLAAHTKQSYVYYEKDSISPTIASGIKADFCYQYGAFYSIGAKIRTTERTARTKIFVFSISGVIRIDFARVSLKSALSSPTALQPHIHTPCSK